MSSIIVAKTAGFCSGVDRAVKLAYSEKGRCCTLGEIIHNKNVTDDLASRGVRIIGDPSQAQPGERVIIRSHGVGSDVYKRLSELGIAYDDGTCPFVRRIQKIVENAPPRTPLWSLWGMQTTRRCRE